MMGDTHPRVRWPAVAGGVRISWQARGQMSGSIRFGCQLLLPCPCFCFTIFTGNFSFYPLHSTQIGVPTSLHFLLFLLLFGTKFSAETLNFFVVVAISLLFSCLCIPWQESIPQNRGRGEMYMKPWEAPKKAPIENKGFRRSHRSSYQATS